MRFLFVSPCIPGRAGTGWEKRAFSFLEAYRQLGTVKLVCTGGEDSAAHARCRALRELGIETYLWPSGEVFGGRGRRLRRLVSRLPLMATVPVAAGFLDELRRLGAWADVVHVFRTHFYTAERVIPPAKIFWDLDECPIAVQRRMIERGELPWHRRLAATYELKRLAPYQGRAVRSVARAFVASEREREHLLAGANVCVVPNAVDIRPEPFDAAAASPDTLLFVGDMTFPPNVDAVRFLCTEILDPLAQLVPTLRVLVVGRGPGHLVQPFLRQGGIELHLDVPSLTPYYARAAITVAPIRFGGGTRVKLLESFSYGVPAVSTALGCEGLAVTDGEHLLIADDPVAFAGACAQLLGDVELRRRLADRARRLVAEKYAPRVVCETLARELRAVVGPVRSADRSGPAVWPSEELPLPGTGPSRDGDALFEAPAPYPGLATTNKLF